MNTNFKKANAEKSEKKGSAASAALPGHPARVG
jgi:hypothetical protein